jgi:PAS domain S-box-containing protein
MTSHGTAAASDAGAETAEAPSACAPLSACGRIARVAAGLLGAKACAIVMNKGCGSCACGAFGASADPWLTAPPPGAAEPQPVFMGDPDPLGVLGAASPGSRFRAAAPLLGPDGGVIGQLRVADDRPHAKATAADRAALADLAAVAAELCALDAEITDIRERRATERERTGIALDAAGLAGFDTDLTGEQIVVSDRLRAMLGLDEAIATIPGEAMFALAHPDDREGLRTAVTEGMQSQRRYSHEYRVVRPSDGRTIWVSTTGVAVIGADGQSGRVIGLLQDITERKADEERREALVAELDHRVKNVLASVQSLAAQSARKASSLEGFLKTFSGRLKSMASAHQLLTATRWRGAGMHNIAAAELGGLAPGQTRWEGPDVFLTPRAANAMSLALHELATNAVKFGALSTEAGRVTVDWRMQADGGLKLNWVEQGGPLVAPPARKGFGTTLLDKVTGRELGGEVRIEHASAGVRAVITAGPSAAARHAEAATVPQPDAAPGTLEGASSGRPDAQQAVRIAGLRVLIVEDALLLALELEAGLQEAGATIVGSAADLEEALGMIDLPLDAAVLDADLNGVSVLPVAEALARRGVPFVFATGYGDGKHGPQGFDAPVIRKPYDVTQVAAALAEATQRA